MAVMSDDNIVIVVGSDGLWDGVPVGTLPLVSCIDFAAEIGPMPDDRKCPRAHSIDGRASEDVHEWWDLPKLRHLTLRYVRPEHADQLAGYRGEWIGVYQGSGLPKDTVWPELPTVRSASWASTPVVSLQQRSTLDFVSRFEQTCADAPFPRGLRTLVALGLSA